MAEDLQGNPSVMNETGAGGIGFDTQWENTLSYDITATLGGIQSMPVWRTSAPDRIRQSCCRSTPRLSYRVTRSTSKTRTSAGWFPVSGTAT
jgi:hypothetical protein